MVGYATLVAFQKRPNSGGFPLALKLWTLTIETTMANPAPKPLSPEDRKLGLERRLAYSRSWYRKQLIGIATGQVIVSPTQFRALLEYGRLMRWNAKITRRKVGTQRECRTPGITDDLLARMTPPVSRESH